MRGSGIIPAYAGQIRWRRKQGKTMRDHPRIRGTNLTNSTSHSALPGSSPHTRDKLYGAAINPAVHRIIPAYAGQMQKVGNRGCLHQDHPRIRGTNYTVLQSTLLFTGSSPHTRDKSPKDIFFPADSRIIPAYAGQIFGEKVLPVLL